MTVKTNCDKKYMSHPSCDLYAPRSGNIYIYIMQVQVHASMNPSTTSSVASLGNIGRWAVAPLHTIEVLHLYRWYTHTCSELHFELVGWSVSDKQNNKVTWKKHIVAQKSSDRLKVRLNWLKKPR